MPAFTFDAPAPLDCELFRLQVLGPEHNERDYEAWTSSMEHIHATHGFADHRWPHPMTLEENLGDMEMHAQEFLDRSGYTYSILEGDAVIGCVYIYPPDEGDTIDATPVDAKVRSWVRVSHAELDGPVRDRLADWLTTDWPFTTLRY